MNIVSAISDLASFGAAGLMGTMWLWERKLSQLRESQLDEAHARIQRDEQRLGNLIKVVEQNTAAVARFNETQRQTNDILKHAMEELCRARTR